MIDWKRVQHLEWAIYAVIGFVPDAKTRRKWVNVGINGVKLRVCSPRNFKALPEWVVEFIYRSNGIQPPEEARQLQPRCLPDAR